MPYADPTQRRLYTKEAQRRRRAVARAVRDDARRQRVADRPQWPAVDLAWAAGMFEGEGTATISVVTNRLGNPSGRCLISLTSTDPQIIEFFHSRWPASTISTRQPKPNHRIAQVWQLHGDRILPFIADITPYLRTDSEKAKFALVEEAQWLRRKGNKDQAVKDRLSTITSEIRQLNRRGVQVETDSLSQVPCDQ